MNAPELLPKEKRAAVFSPCRKYRYTLHIVWDEYRPLVQFIGLNPSTADEFKDDPTVRKCKQFARNWGYGGMVMTNIFAFRSTDPRPMKRHPKPIGHGEIDNDFHLFRIADMCSMTVAAWGNHGTHLGRGQEVRDQFLTFNHPLKCFRITKAGMPEHPLYVPYTTELKEYTT